MWKNIVLLFQHNDGVGISYCPSWIYSCFLFFARKYAKALVKVRHLMLAAIEQYTYISSKININVGVMHQYLD